MRTHENFELLLGQLAKKLKAMRVKAGLSQEALALAADIDRTYISQLERGIANPSLLILYRIAKELNVEISVNFVTPKNHENIDNLGVKNQPSES